jgi:hypothetical protein
MKPGKTMVRGMQIALEMGIRATLKITGIMVPIKIMAMGTEMKRTRVKIKRKKKKEKNRKRLRQKWRRWE